MRSHMWTGTRIVLAADRGGVGEALAKRLRKLKVEVLSLDPSAERSDVEGQLDGWLSTGAVQGVGIAGVPTRQEVAARLR